MATYLRPKRGKKATANSVLSGTNKLKAGEIFFEVPTNYAANGYQGRLMMGDGTSNYSDLKAFLAFDMNNVQTFSNVTSANTREMVGSISPSAPLAKNLQNIKQSLLNLYRDWCLKLETPYPSSRKYLATISATSSTSYATSFSMEYFKFIEVRLIYSSSTGNQTSVCTKLIPYQLFKFYTSNFYINYKYNNSNNAYGRIRYYDDNTVYGYTNSSSYNMALYGVEMYI